MPPTAVSTAHLDYLLRRFDPPPLHPDQLGPGVPPGLRRLWHVRGIGVTPQQRPTAASADHRHLTAGGALIGAMQGALVGLYGYKIPVCFLLDAAGEGGITVGLGTWSIPTRERVDAAVLDARSALVRSVLGSLYPRIDAAPGAVLTPDLPLAGLVLGHPSAPPLESLADVTAIDRLIWGLSGSRWGVLVLADPVQESVSAAARNAVLNEVRAVQADTEAMAASSPLGRLYIDLLRTHLIEDTRGLGEGAWRTAVYLLGDELSYYRLAAVWRSAFCGQAAQPSGAAEPVQEAEPLRVVQDQLAPRLAREWSMPDVPGAAGPGWFQHLFCYQSLLTSSQLARYVQFPRTETSGFAVEVVPTFDCVPARVPEGDSIALGDVVERGAPTSVPYRIAVSMLTRHALVAGVTGAGKTNTVFAVLRQLCSRNIPFLVIEPAKTEYRALLDDALIGPRLRVFTVGVEGVAPLRLNPLEFEPHTAVGTHIDLLKSVFNASFGMWSPLPQVLERCIHQVYADQGWDPTRGGNTRLADVPCSASEPPWDPWALPTLTGLYLQVEETVDRLGYDDKVTSDIKAALLTRLDSLRIGAKGAMLDTHHSVPLTELLSGPTVIELEGIGDDDEKAFVMGLLLVRLYEHLRCSPVREGGTLAHLTVIEEAHRLLPNVTAATNPEQGDMRGKAVETFVNMLSEVRAYGQGILVAEQIPTKLAPDVLKSTNLKVVHRTVAESERRALGGTMNMDEPQVELLATLGTGEAAVFAEGDDSPLIVLVPYVKPASPRDASAKRDSDARVAAQMRPLLDGDLLARAFVPQPLCPVACGTPYRYCQTTKPLVESSSFRLRFASLPLCAALAPGRLGAHSASLLATLRADLPEPGQEPGGYQCAVLTASSAYISDIGRRYAWGYGESRMLREQLSALASSSMAAVLDGRAQPDSREFAELYLRACRRRYDPFPACARLCPTGHCLFRYHAAMLAGDRALNQALTRAMAASGLAGSWTDLRAVSDVVSRLDAVDLPPEHRRSLGLCFGVQQIAAMPGLLDEARRLAVADLIDGYDDAALPRQGAAGGPQEGVPAHD